MIKKQLKNKRYQKHINIEPPGPMHGAPWAPPWGHPMGGPLGGPMGPRGLNIDMCLVSFVFHIFF